MKRLIPVILAAGAVALAGCHNRPAGQSEIPVPPVPATEGAPRPVVATQPAAQAAPVVQQTSAPEALAPAAPQPVPAQVAPKPEILASLDDVQITRETINRLVMESHGLNMLLRVVQVELAKSAAEQNGLKVTPEDVRRERRLTLGLITKDATQKLRDDIAEAREKKDDARVASLQEELAKDQESMLQQLLGRENMTIGEFALLMESNAYIRAIVEKQIEGKITEENLHEAFMNLYGENVRVRHIQLANMAEVAEAKRRLASGEPFESVAREMSRNAATRNLGGELPPFSRENQGLPDSFKQVAFTLKKPGEISEPVEANGSYHLIRLSERIAPKAVKFESVKESVREQLHDRWVSERMKAFREQLGRKVMESLKIEDSMLARQFRDRVLKRDTEIKERDQIARELAREREAAARASAEAATRPSSTTRPILTEEGTIAIDQEQLRPPATRSGSDTPDTQPATGPSHPTRPQSPSSLPTTHP